MVDSGFPGMCSGSWRLQPPDICRRLVLAKEAVQLVRLLKAHFTWPFIALYHAAALVHGCTSVIVEGEAAASICTPQSAKGNANIGPPHVCAAEAVSLVVLGAPSTHTLMHTPVASIAMRCTTLGRVRAPLHLVCDTHQHTHCKADAHTLTVSTHLPHRALCLCSASFLGRMQRHMQP